MSIRHRVKLIVIRITRLFIGALIRVFLRVPAHIAIIMDGNRRFARRADLGIDVGYRRGHEKLMNIMRCCSLLGMRELTVYAFSIENFKRSEEEVSGIMRLAREKFQQFLDEMDDMKAWGIRVRIVGRQELVSPEMVACGARAALATRHNHGLQLNIACPYTGRDEISRAASCIVDGVRSEELSAEDVDEELVSSVLELGAPQLLVRTSGEVRLSDYMLWQVSNTVLYFSEKLWPEFSVLDLLIAVWHYTRYAPVTPASKPKSSSGGRQRERFLENVKRARWQKLEKLAAS